jgi:tetratricopeptide (TPR) repeat protein
MKTRLIIVAALFLSALSPTAFGTIEKNPPQTGKSETFLMAQAAYDDGRYAEASMLYEKLLSNGIANVEIQYNIANAYFKNSELPQAVWHYRKAWYAAPRDPDIRANMHFALNAAGAVEPSPSFIEKTFFVLSQNEWIQAAIAAYVIFTLLLIMGMLIRPAKRMMVKLSLIPAILILMAAGGWWHWQQMKILPESVVIKSGATALFGPVEGSTAHYKVPLAALVRQRSNDSKGWVEIEYDGKNGWLKAEYIQRVSP